MADQTVVDAITKVLTDNGYTAPADTSQLSAQVDSFVLTAGFTLALPEDDDSAEIAEVQADQSAIDADNADAASKQADIDSVNAQEQAEDSQTPSTPAAS